MGYRKATIYFASGTGNSYRVAFWFHEACKARGIESEIIPINLANPRDEIKPSSENLVVLAYPTHGLMPPWSAIKFIFTLPFKRGAHVFAIPTRGSFFIGRLLIPGAAGLASLLPMIVLPFKGYLPRGARSFDMPVNMINIHGRLSESQIARINNGAKRIADKSFASVLSGKSIWFTLNNLWELGWIFLLLWYHALFPVAYLLIGRFFMGKAMFATNDCIGCGLCAKSCPNNAIAMIGDDNPRPLWRFNCEVCLRCMAYCKQRAAETGHSWALILYFISSFPASRYIYDFLEAMFPHVDFVKGYYMHSIVNAVYLYPAYTIFYYLFFMLLRFKPVNTLFSYTTLTHYFRRYHDPLTDIGDLTSRKT